MDKDERKDAFIAKARTVHNNKYDYSLVEYVNAHKKVKILCPEHGVFEQNANNHLNGQGCPVCKSFKQRALKKVATQHFSAGTICQRVYDAMMNYEVSITD